MATTIAARSVVSGVVGVVMTGAARGVSGSRVVSSRIVARGVIVMTVARDVKVAVARGGSGSRVVSAPTAPSAGRSGSGSRVVSARIVAHVVKVAVARGVSGSRVVSARIVARDGTTDGVRVEMIGVTTDVASEARVASMMRTQRQRMLHNNVAPRCLRERAHASTAKTNRLHDARIVMNASLTKARCAVADSRATIANPTSVRGFAATRVAMVRSSQHRRHSKSRWRGRYARRWVSVDSTT